MRRVILQEFVTVDGRASGPKDSVDFVPASTQGDQSFGRQQLTFIDSIDAILLGRVTYTMFAEYWPDVTAGDDKPFADKLNAIPKIVFSRTLERAPWGKWEDAKVVSGSATKEVAKLKEKPGKDMVIWGSISLAQSLMDEGLIDEYRLVVCPIVIGDGKPLFGGRAQDMKLVKSTSYDRGAVQLVYVPTKTARAR